MHKQAKPPERKNRATTKLATNECIELPDKTFGERNFGSHNLLSLGRNLERGYERTWASSLVGTWYVVHTAPSETLATLPKAHRWRSNGRYNRLQWAISLWTGLAHLPLYNYSKTVTGYLLLQIEGEWDQYRNTITFICHEREAASSFSFEWNLRKQRRLRK